MPSKTQSILLGGLVAGLLSTSYLSLINVLCCAGVIIGAIVAVWHYTSTYDLTIPTGQGATMGALAAVLGGIIGAALTYLLEAIGLPGVQELMMGYYEGFLTPEQLAQIEQQQEAGASTGMSIIFFFVSLFIYAIFGAVGGAIGAAVFKKGNGEEGDGSQGVVVEPTPTAP